MSMTILVPLDGSPLAEQALMLAVPLASRDTARLVLVRAVPAASAAAYGDPHAHRAVATRERADRAAAEAELSTLAERVQHDGLSVSTHVTVGDPATAIANTAADEAADLIVMSTHARGRSQHRPCGHVAEAVLGHTPVPCILVPSDGQHASPTDRPPRVVVALDESEAGDIMPQRVLSVLTAWGAEVLLLRVLDPPHYLVRPGGSATGPIVVQADVTAGKAQLARTAEPLRAALGRPVATHVAVSPYAGSTIAEVAREHRADLIVLGRRREAGGATPPLGGVALDVLALADCPVLLVVPPVGDLARRGAAASLSISLSRQEVDLVVRALDGLLAHERESSTRELAGELLAHLHELTEGEQVSSRDGQ